VVISVDLINWSTNKAFLTFVFSLRRCRLISCCKSGCNLPLTQLIKSRQEKMMRRSLRYDDDVKSSDVTVKMEVTELSTEYPSQNVIDEWITTLTRENYESVILDNLVAYCQNKTTEQITQETKRQLDWVKSTAFAPLPKKGNNGLTPEQEEKELGTTLESTIMRCIIRGGTLLRVIFEWNVDPTILNNRVDEIASGINAEIRDTEKYMRDLPISYPEMSATEMKFTKEKVQMREISEENFKQDYLKARKAAGLSETLDDFESSDQYAEFVKNEVTINNRIRMRAIKEYDNLVIEYQDRKAQRTLTEKTVEELKARRTTCSVASTLTAFYGQYFDQILTSVRNAAMGTNILTKLSGHIRIPKTGELVTNPLSPGVMHSLPAVYYILEKHYKTANVVMLCESLITLLNFQISSEDSRNSPEKGIQLMGKIISHWQQTNLFDYMDLDKLITMSILRGYAPNTEVRTQGVQRVLRYAQRLADENYVSSPGEMPLFNELSRYVTDELALGRQLSSQKSSNSDYSNRKFTTPYNKGHSPPKGTESAAAAKAEPERREAKGPFPKEVKRSDNYWVKEPNSGNYMFYYTATKSPCPNCGTPNHPSCPAPKCYLQQCSNCKLYGHKSKNCLQQKEGAHSAEETALF